MMLWGRSCNASSGQATKRYCGSPNYWNCFISTYKVNKRPRERAIKTEIKTNVYYDYIQLFRQRLSHESVKAYATMPIGIMGSKSLALLDWASRRFSNKEQEKMKPCLCCFLPPRWNTLGFTQATVKTTTTHNNFRHCRVSFSPF